MLRTAGRSPNPDLMRILILSLLFITTVLTGCTDAVAPVEATPVDHPAPETIASVADYFEYLGVFDEQQHPASGVMVYSFTAAPDQFGQYQLLDEVIEELPTNIIITKEKSCKDPYGKVWAYCKTFGTGVVGKARLGKWLSDNFGDCPDGCTDIRSITGDGSVTVYAQCCG